MNVRSTMYAYNCTEGGVRWLTGILVSFYCMGYKGNRMRKTTMLILLTINKRREGSSLVIEALVIR
jgi:hypothetical protein